MLLAISGPGFWSVGLAVTGLMCLVAIWEQGGSPGSGVLFPVLHDCD